MRHGDTIGPCVTTTLRGTTSTTTTAATGVAAPVVHGRSGVTHGRGLGHGHGRGHG
jgi:hypothetical protein